MEFSRVLFRSVAPSRAPPLPAAVQTVRFPTELPSPQQPHPASCRQSSKSQNGAFQEQESPLDTPQRFALSFWNRDLSSGSSPSEFYSRIEILQLKRL